MVKEKKEKTEAGRRAGLASGDGVGAAEQGGCYKAGAQGRRAVAGVAARAAAAARQKLQAVRLPLGTGGGTGRRTENVDSIHKNK